ncbi:MULTISPECIES: hypothetical protein [Bradyrhizobium]|jgi:hypothetical protein|uniref:hypothetical protein n=2 Tax=Nitrobacteraceae TaxID=41294 RepID=UPI0003A82944|nr:hypothetical protein [Bradyrhizobium denitrificans]MCL8482721.1 hypothetical protein [Bradyrhizobium denitrificans]RTL97194.1 MAG: hypothetical protein EKK32_21380 [Bradyrhizobiaceae bacterium]
MADADLDAVIRQLAKQQNKTILAAAKKRRDRFSGLAMKAKDKDAKERYKMLAREVAEQANAAARRLLISADNVADSYARAMRQAAAAELPKKPEKPQKSEKSAAAAPAKPDGKSGKKSVSKPAKAAARKTGKAAA